MTMKPTFIAYTVKNRGRNQSAIWTKIGAAWAHEKGKGFNIELSALPVDGKIVLIEPDTDERDGVTEAVEGGE